MNNTDYIQSLMLYLSQGAGAIILALILYRFFKSYKHEYLLSWCLSWIGFALYLIGASITYSLINVLPPTDSVRLFITLGSLFFGYFQLVFLVKGTYEVSTKKLVNPKIVSLSVILILVASVIFVFASLEDPNPLTRVLIRAGFRSVMSGLSFLIAAALIYRSPLIFSGLGVKMVFWTFLIYGLQQFNYAVAIAVGYTGNDYLFGFTTYLGVVDLLIQCLMGVGMLVWLLEDESRELKKTNKDLDSIVYSTSHDLRAPLLSVLGLINVAKEEKDINKVTRYFELAEDRIKKLDGIISDIMTFSRNTKVDIRRERFLLKEAIEETIKDLKFTEGLDSIKVNIDVSPETFIQSDKERLKIILSNLISNSIKYRGRTDPYIKISARQLRDKMVLSVEDNGVGIDKENLPRIFEMFYRASEGSNGSGLGLFIVKEAVERLNGTIKVTSAPSQGTIFKIELPF